MSWGIARCLKCLGGLKPAQGLVRQLLQCGHMSFACCQLSHRLPCCQDVLLLARHAGRAGCLKYLLQHCSCCS